MEFELSKIDAAVDQLDWAIRLFLDHKAYVPAITLAGAADEVLGQAVGSRAVFDVLKKKFAADFSLPEKVVSQAHLNRAKNWLKHWDGRTDDEKIRLELEETHEGTLLPEEVSLALFRIYQETLTNFTKHARATKGTVRLISTPGQVILEMEDNGVGFSLPKDWLELARRGHLGLVGMRERAEAIGGRLQVDSQPGQGSRIQVVVPIQNRVENSSFPS